MYFVSILIFNFSIYKFSYFFLFFTSLNISIHSITYRPINPFCFPIFSHPPTRLTNHTSTHPTSPSYPSNPTYIVKSQISVVVFQPIVQHRHHHSTPRVPSVPRRYHVHVVAFAVLWGGGVGCW